MSMAHQEEYMKLPNKYKDVESMPESIMDLKYYESLLRSSGQSFEKKNLEIIAIYATNIAQCLTFKGVYLKISQFHHSCQPNSVVLFRDNVEIRAIKKIRNGDQITINQNGSNSLFGLIPRKIRLKILYENEFFICSCERCQVW